MDLDTANNNRPLFNEDFETTSTTSHVFQAIITHSIAKFLDLRQTTAGHFPLPHK